MFTVVLMLLAQAPPDPHPELPPLSDARRFGFDGKSVRQQFQRHQRHLEWLRKRIADGDSDPRLFRWADEACWRLRAYDLLDDVVYCGYEEGVKRLKLEQIRAIIGVPNYDAGQMPAPYPEMSYP